MTAIPITSPTTPATGPWSAEVLEFAAQRGVTAYLDPLLEAARRVFPTARLIAVKVERDPEIAECDGILFEVHVPARDIPDAAVVAAFRAWHDESWRVCPGDRVLNFLLGLDREES